MKRSFDSVFLSVFVELERLDDLIRDPLYSSGVVKSHLSSAFLNLGNMNS